MVHFFQEEPEFCGVFLTYVGDPLFRAILPDTEIAKKYGSSRTKTYFLMEMLAMIQIILPVRCRTNHSV